MYCNEAKESQLASPVRAEPYSPGRVAVPCFRTAHHVSSYGPTTGTRTTPAPQYPLQTIFFVFGTHAGFSAAPAWRPPLRRFRA